MIYYDYLTDGGGANVWSSKSWTSGAAVVSDPVNVSQISTGDGIANAFIITRDSASSPDNDFTIEYSVDGTHWYDPYLGSTSKVLIEDAIATDLYTVFIIYPTNWIRITCDPDATGVQGVMFGFNDKY